MTVQFLLTVFLFCPCVSSDVDECATDTHNCSWGADCFNNKGSFACSCSSGFSGDGFYCVGRCTLTLYHKLAYLSPMYFFFNSDPFTILDIDECVIGTHNCHKEAECSNTNGTFYCNCSNGFFGNGTHCEGKVELLKNKELS